MSDQIGNLLGRLAGKTTAKALALDAASLASSHPGPSDVAFDQALCAVRDKVGTHIDAFNPAAAMGEVMSLISKVRPLVFSHLTARQLIAVSPDERLLLRRPAMGSDDHERRPRSSLRQDLPQPPCFCHPALAHHAWPHARAAGRAVSPATGPDLGGGRDGGGRRRASWTCSASEGRHGSEAEAGPLSQNFGEMRCL